MARGFEPASRLTRQQRAPHNTVCVAMNQVVVGVGRVESGSRDRVGEREGLGGERLGRLGYPWDVPDEDGATGDAMEPWAALDEPDEHLRANTTTRDRVRGGDGVSACYTSLGLNLSLYVCLPARPATRRPPARPPARPPGRLAACVRLQRTVVHHGRKA